MCASEKTCEEKTPFDFDSSMIEEVFPGAGSIAEINISCSDECVGGTANTAAMQATQ
ncbi:hypothetical protein [uncultured Rhodoblastus sp.]|uniref:hypothetical protein n=1 Tax=uncultured Rhodoblastus sp. TaxID=543037 RepID=UPI0025DCEB09|nr:hypothetical protein [uncultured Rhodoblastus sp.]